MADDIIRKLAGFQTLILPFDGLSAVTPQFFIDNIEEITTLTKSSDDEKLLVLRSRLRGDALSNVLNSPDLNNEKNYKEFKSKFLQYFQTNYSLAAKQRQFAECRMTSRELIKTYAARVSIASQNLFESPDLTNPEIKSLLEKTKLAKFTEGLCENYKQAVILKDPKTFDEAVSFAQTLQSNQFSTLNTDPMMVNNIKTKFGSEDIQAILEAHASNTKQMIDSLREEIENLKLSNHQMPQNRTTFYDSNPQTQFIRTTNNRRNTTTAQRNTLYCSICRRNSHNTSNCFYNPETRGNFRGRNNFFQNRRDRFQGGNYRGRSRYQNESTEGTANREKPEN